MDAISTNTAVTEPKVAVADAKARFSELVDRAARGEAFTITRYGKPLARLTPIEEATLEGRRARIAAAFDDWNAYRRAHPTGITREEIREWFKEDRRST